LGFLVEGRRIAKEKPWRKKLGGRALGKRGKSE
jgi:hypothetical protein